MSLHLIRKNEQVTCAIRNYSFYSGHQGFGISVAMTIILIYSRLLELVQSVQPPTRLSTSSKINLERNLVPRDTFNNGDNNSWLLFWSFIKVPLYTKH